jgi:hypothetical protein
MFWPFNSRGTITDDISWAQWLWRTCLEHRTSRSSSAIILVYVVHPAIYHNFDVVSLNLRAFIRHHHRPRQGINPLVLSACISPQIAPFGVLDDDWLLRGKHSRIPHCNNLSMSSDRIRLEQGP